jgi:hypothetical protein
MTHRQNPIGQMPMQALAISRKAAMDLGYLA